MNKPKNKQGFTLIELILYIALVSVFLVGAIFFSWDIIYGREKAFQSQLVEQNTRSALQRISYEIRRAQGITTLTPTSVVLNNGATATTIELASGVIQITTNGSGPFALTSNQVNVTSLSFTDQSSTNLDSKNIKTSLTLTQKDPNPSTHFQASTTMSESVELNPDFNQARQLLLDATQINLNNKGDKVQDITIENTSATPITITHITPTWTNGNFIERIKVDNNKVWDDGGGIGLPVGVQSSGTTLDIIDVVLAPGSTSLIDEFRFDNDMTGDNLTLLFTMLDGSTRTMLISNLGSAGGGGGGGGGTEASNLVVNTTGATPKPGKTKEIIGITIENTSATPITITHITPTWTNGTTIKQIKLGGTKVWDRKGPGTPTGAQPSATLLDIVDVVVPAGGGAINIDKLKFNSSMSGDTLGLTFTMLDGSTLIIPPIAL